MATSEDEAIKIFGDLVKSFEALTYADYDLAKINALLSQTRTAIRKTFGDESEYLSVLPGIKIVRLHAKKSNRAMYFEKEKQEAIGLLNNILVELRLSKNRQNQAPVAQDHTLGINSSSSFTPGFVFIAMPMSPDDPALEDVHEAIKDAVSKLELVAQRTDEQPTNERITDRILESLAQAEFVIADLTHSRPNVYWEAGFAHALGKTPIYIAREGTSIEFDLKDYPVIFFKNITHLKRELTKRLNGLKNKRS